MLHPSDISNKTFDKCMKGYKPDAVEDYLEIISKEYTQLLEEKETTEKKLEVLAEKIQEYRDDEDSLRAALVGAQKLGDSVIREAKEKADKILREASKKAEYIIVDAKHAVSKEKSSLIKMKKEVSRFKNQLFALYKSHLELIGKLSDVVDDEKLEDNKKADLEVKKENNLQVNEKEENEANPTENIRPLEYEEIDASQEDEIQECDEDNEIDNNTDRSQSNYKNIKERKKAPINDEKFGPLKFGNDYNSAKDEVYSPKEKGLFSKRKNR